MRSGPTRHSFDGFGSPRPPRRCARRRARKEPRARAPPGSRAARLLAWPRPAHCGDAAARLRLVTHQRRERLASDLPSPEPFHAAVGWPSPQLVADSLASRAGGRVAGAEHAVRSGLLAQRGVAAIDGGARAADGVDVPRKRPNKRPRVRPTDVSLRENTRP